METMRWISAIILSLFGSIAEARASTVDPDAGHLSSYAVSALVRQGVDFRSQYFNLDVFTADGKIDHVYDFRFGRLAAVEAKLKGVNRPNTLKAIYKAITAGATNNNEKLYRVLKFVQSNMFGNAVQAMYPDGTGVFDPLVAMSLSEYRCGIAARIIIDLFEAGEGWPGRLWQVRNHVTGEIFYDGDWHMAEATFFEDGEGIRRPDGSYPSYNELWSELSLLDRPPSYMEPGMDFRDGKLTWMQARRTSNLYPSSVYYNLVAPLKYVVKTRPMDLATDKYYGWTSYQVTTLLGPTPVPMHYLPTAPEVSDIDIARQSDGSANVTVTWGAALDGDNDIANYRVMVGSKSRLWNYPRYDGSVKLACLATVSNPNPEIAYTALNEVPPHDLSNIETTALSTTFSIPAGQTAYLSIVAQDAYGLSIGRQVFLPSNEYAIGPGQTGCED